MSQQACGFKEGEGSYTFVICYISVPLSLSFFMREIGLVWNLQTRELLHTFTGHSSSVSVFAVTPDGHKSVTGSWDQTVRVWDLVAMDGSAVVLEGHTAAVDRVFVTDDGLRIISVGDEENVFVWEIATGELVNRFTLSDARVMSRREVFEIIGLKTVADDATLSIRWDRIRYGEGEDAKVIATMEAGIQSWALSPDQKTICVGLWNGHVGLMKLKREKEDAMQ